MTKPPNDSRDREKEPSKRPKRDDDQLERFQLVIIWLLVISATVFVMFRLITTLATQE